MESKPHNPEFRNNPTMHVATKIIHMGQLEFKRRHYAAIHYLLLFSSTGSTQEKSQHDWKMVDMGIKYQIKHTKNLENLVLIVPL